MNMMQFAIARTVAQLLEQSKTRKLDKKELRLLEVLMPEVDRYKKAELSRG